MSRNDSVSATELVYGKIAEFTAKNCVQPDRLEIDSQYLLEFAADSPRSISFVGGKLHILGVPAIVTEDGCILFEKCLNN